MNKKILMVANDTTFLYKLRKEIIKHFIEDGFQVTLVAHKLSFVEELESIGAQIINLQFNRTSINPFKDIKVFLNIGKILLAEKPDLVFTNSIKPNIYFGILCQILSIKYVPNISGLGRALEYKGAIQSISIFLYKIAMRKVNYILFQNEFNKDFFIDKNIIYKNTDYIVLPGSGVNTDEYNLLEYPKNDKIVFLFIARIRREKGIDFIINAAKIFSEKYKNIEFNICGLCEDEFYLNQLSELENKGILKYHGEQADLTKFYKDAYCILHPTYYPEGMSNVLLEASSHGRPIITTDRPGCKEIIDDSVNGYMVKVQDQDSFNNAISKFIKLPYLVKKNMGLNGRKKIMEKFDRKRVVALYDRIVKEMEDVSSNE